MRRVAVHFSADRPDSRLSLYWLLTMRKWLHLSGRLVGKNHFENFQLSKVEIEKYVKLLFYYGQVAQFVEVQLIYILKSNLIGLFYSVARSNAETWL